jgi:hypothetical protein
MDFTQTPAKNKRHFPIIAYSAGGSKFRTKSKARFSFSREGAFFMLQKSTEKPILTL